jgi:hypothetical protein
MSESVLIMKLLRKLMRKLAGSRDNQEPLGAPCAVLNGMPMRNSNLKRHQDPEFRRVHIMITLGGGTA